MNDSGGSVEPFITYKQAAEHLGCSKSTLYWMVQQQSIRHYRRGRMVRFRVSDLDKLNIQPSPSRRKDESKPSWLYLIRCGEFVKIGVARKPKWRLVQLQTATPYDLELVSTFPDSPGLEHYLHTELSHIRVRGEWFRWSDDIPEVVAKLIERRKEAT